MRSGTNMDRPLASTLKLYYASGLNRFVLCYWPSPKSSLWRKRDRLSAFRVHGGCASCSSAGAVHSWVEIMDFALKKLVLERSELPRREPKQWKRFFRMM